MTFSLKCCGRTDPIGMDKENIRLSFGLDGSMAVSTYEISLWDAAGPVCTLKGQAEDGFTVWADPGLLKDATAYTWRVRARLSDGSMAVSGTGTFETGISCWQARWISGDAPEGRVLEFQKEFPVDRLPEKARLYICGLGYFSAKLNGKVLDGSCFIPPVTDYTVRPDVDAAHTSTSHRVSYYTYDVTGLLRQGSNSLTAEVAGGYYSSREKLNYEPQPDFSFGQPCLIYELHFEDENGNVTKLLSGTDTQVRGTHESAQLYSGDVVDFTEEPEKFGPARLTKAPEGVMTAPQCESDRVKQILTPVASWQTPEGTVYDFGVNHSGGLQLTAEAAEETELVIRYAEVLREDGSLNFETAAWHGKHIVTGEKKHIYQQNTYRLKKGSNAIAPKFSWFCYRYALIPSSEQVRISQPRSLFIHMDVPQDGSFRCGNALLQRVNDTFLQTLYCNMHSGLVMDCPHRERLPYTGDGGLIMKSACYNLNVTDFYYKWFQDLLDAQTLEGLIPNSAPYMGGGGGYAWGNAICTVSKLLYTFTGDMTVARRGYEAVRKWIGYYETKRDENYIIRSNSHTWMLGDWLAPQTVTSDVYYISTVCYLQAVKTALFFARILDAPRCGEWEALQKRITEGINRVLFDKEKLIYGNGVQGENVLALAEDIVPGEYRGRMEEALRRHYTVETEYHLDTGVVLTPVLLEHLTDHGCRHIAWKIMTRETYPSYFTLMENDTTFSEHWSKKWPDYYFGEPGNSRLVKGGGELSHCHPMYGSVAAWLYERVAGLDLSRLYKGQVRVMPYFMDCLPWAEAKKNTAFGEVSVAWSRNGGAYTLAISIPRGLTAQCHFPAVCDCLTDPATGRSYYPDEKGYFDFSVGAGQWRFTNSSGEGTA